MNARIPVFGICGYSGSGKTTLIEALLGRLAVRGLRIAVIKHDAHGFDVDRKGKDSHRFFQAGADVIMRSPEQIFMRGRRAAACNLETVLDRVGAHYDMILVEGHKTTPLPDKIWLLGEGETVAPSEAGAVTCVLARDADRVGGVMALIGARLPAIWLSSPVRAGILIGGKASRMGRPKHLIEISGTTWLERSVAVLRPLVEDVLLLGGGPVPASLRDLKVLPDVPGLEGPLAGILAAMRWHPYSSWLIAACDHPFLSREAAQWLLSTRAPGVWATIPIAANGQGFEALLAHYDFRARGLLEAVRGPSGIVGSDRVITPAPPSGIREAWRSVNTPGELAALPE